MYWTAKRSRTKLSLFCTMFSRFLIYYHNPGNYGPEQSQGRYSEEY